MAIQDVMTNVFTFKIYAVVIFTCMTYLYVGHIYMVIYT